MRRTPSVGTVTNNITIEDGIELELTTCQTRGGVLDVVLTAKGPEVERRSRQWQIDLDAAVNSLKDEGMMPRPSAPGDALLRPMIPIVFLDEETLRYSTDRQWSIQGTSAPWTLHWCYTIPENASPKALVKVIVPLASTQESVSIFEGPLAQLHEMPTHRK